MKHHTGSIEVITGSMFSGKTDELIRRLRPRHDRPPEGAGFQACHRQPLCGRKGHLARRQRF